MIPVAQTEFPVSALTHPGMTGKNNEDRYAVTAFRLKPDHPMPILLAVLADGIGGHRAGEVAAGIAVERVTQQVGKWPGHTHPQQELRQALVQASQEIYSLAQSQEGRRGMGATCSVAWIIGRHLYTATVGDSRLYLMRGGTIRQVSTDHTWVQEAIQHGILKPEEARSHPNAHVIRRYLGSPQPPEVDFRLRLSDTENDALAQANQGLTLQTGDRILLCSDGLTDLVNASEILAAYQSQPLDAATHALVQLACQRGGHDNITITVIEVPPLPPQKRSRFSWKWILALLAVAALGIGGFLLLTRTSPPEGATPTLSSQTSLPGQALLPTQPTVAPSLTPTPRPTSTRTLVPTLPGAPQRSGATLTAWPTNTSSPTSTQTPAPTETSTATPSETAAGSPPPVSSP